MVPVLDFCNHATNANARYEMNSNGDVILLLIDIIEDGAEICIKYVFSATCVHVRCTFICAIVAYTGKITSSLMQNYNMQLW